MKNYKVYMDLDNVQSLVQKLYELDCDILIVEGALNDTYIINTEHLQGSHKLGRVKFRKYMILGHEFANEWGDHLYMELTDSEKNYNSWVEVYDEQQKQLEEEEAGLLK